MPHEGCPAPAEEVLQTGGATGDDCGKPLAAALTSMPFEVLAAEIQALSQPKFRAAQLFGWLHAKRVDSFDAMSNLPAALRQQLAGCYTIERPAVARVQESADGTRKYLLRMADGECVEAVRMKYHHGSSLCISTQVGCRMGCRFCASTKGGLVRNLTAGEMAGEVYAVLEETRKTRAQRVFESGGEEAEALNKPRDAAVLEDARQTVPITNIVLMGVGEPLDNFDAVVDFLSIITHPEGYGLSGRNISLSTCGLVPGIRRLAGLRLPLTLSVSLHAATDEARSAMMPVNDAFSIDQLMQACQEYRAQTGRRISFEYALAQGVNDGPEDARRLAALLRGTDAHVNLIPVNEAGREGFRTSGAGAVAAFQKELAARGVNATVRRTLGADISAACGQLRSEHAEVDGLGHFASPPT